MSSETYIPPQRRINQEDPKDSPLVIIITNPLHKDFVEVLNSQRERPKELNIRYYDFITLIENLDVVINATNISTLIIITDAENDCSRLRDVVNAQDKRNVCKGIWAFPNNQDSGGVIDFWANITSCPSSVIKRIDIIIKENEKEENIIIPDNKKGIARCYALLALQQDPVHSFKEAINKGYINNQAPCYIKFDNWLNSALDDE